MMVAVTQVASNKDEHVACCCRFKTLSPAGKKKYEEEANKLKAEVAAVREAKKAGKPKRAPTAYTCFVQQVMPATLFFAPPCSS